MPQNSSRPLTNRAQRAIELADARAAYLGLEYVGTEHLLMGLLEEKTGPAAQLLTHLGLTAERVQAAWKDVTGKEL